MIFCGLAGKQYIQRVKRSAAFRAAEEREGIWGSVLAEGVSPLGMVKVYSFNV